MAKRKASDLLTDDEDAIHENMDINMYEAETMYFGFTPLSFVDNVINAVNSLTYDAIDGLMKTALNSKKLSKDQLEKICTCLLNALHAHIDKNFDKFELYVLQNILRIPNAITIPGCPKISLNEYSNRCNDDPSSSAINGGNVVLITAESESALRDEVKALRNRIRGAAYVREVLKKELLAVETLERYNTTITDQLGKITTICRRSNIDRLSESVDFVNDQAQQLRATIDNIKPLLEEQRGLSSANENSLSSVSTNIGNGDFAALKASYETSRMNRSSPTK